MILSTPRRTARVVVGGIAALALYAGVGIGPVQADPVAPCRIPRGSTLTDVMEMPLPVVAPCRIPRPGPVVTPVLETPLPLVGLAPCRIPVGKSVTDVMEMPLPASDPVCRPASP